MNSKSRRRSKRHELDSSKQLAVKILRDRSEQSDADSKALEAKIVDISVNGFKLNSKTAFEFQEKIRVELPSSDGKSITTTAEVRWIEPNPNGRSWSVGCLIVDAFPQKYIDEMAREGILDRRASARHKINQTATGRWELTPEDQTVKIVDVSANGVAIFIKEEAEIGKRIRIRLGDQRAITARAVWQQPQGDGFVVGCEVVEGSPYSVIEASLSNALQGVEDKMGRYQVLSLCGLSLFLVMLIREWFF